VSGRAGFFQVSNRHGQPLEWHLTCWLRLEVWTWKCGMKHWPGPIFRHSEMSSCSHSRVKGESSNFRILGIPTFSFQQKLYSQTIARGCSTSVKILNEKNLWGKKREILDCGGKIWPILFQGPEKSSCDLFESSRLFRFFRLFRPLKGWQKRKTEKAKGPKIPRTLQPENRGISAEVNLKMCTWRLPGHTQWIPKTYPNII